MTVLAIAANNLRRLARTRTNLFFIFALPLMLILVLGLTVGSDELRIGISVEGAESIEVEELITSIEDLDGATVIRFDDRSDAVAELEREDITALVVFPEGFTDALVSGETVGLEYLAIPSSGGREMQSIVESAVANRNVRIRASRLVGEETGLAPADAAEQVSSVAANLDPVEVEAVDPDGNGYVDADAVGFVAAQELVLFVFLIGMVAASALIQERRLGVTRRMLATNATTGQIVAGQALGRYAIAMLQAGFIVGSTALMFGLDWGSWPATAAVIASFSLVATAAAMFVGALVTNESQTGAVGMSLGLALAALGGCMVPFEIFPDWLRTVAHVTPHAWAVDAFTEVIQRGGGLGQIGTELAVLVGFGIALLAAASVALRRAIIV